MFDSDYQTRNQKRIKNIVDFYDHKFIYLKKVLDLGTGHADIGGALYRLGADVTVVDARPEHLKIAAKKFSGIKTLKADLDRDWPFKGKKFDIILSLDLLCHLRDYQQHLRDVCSSTTHLVLETAVCDSSDPNKCVVLSENKGSYDLSINGVACRPSAAAIERVLDECGMNFKRVDSNKLNVAPYTYDWQSKNNDDTSVNQRRMWYAVKKNSVVQFAQPTPPPLVSSQVVGQPNYKINQHNPRPIKAIPRPPGQMYKANKMPSNSNNITTNYTVSSSHYNSVGSDEYGDLSKNFSILPSENYNVIDVFDTIGIIQCNTFSSAQWINKLLPMFHNLKLTNSPNLLKQRTTDEKPNVVLGALGSLSICERIWIEEFQGQKISEKDDFILNQASYILSPSLPNTQFLRRKYSNKKIIYTPKLWPNIKTDGLMLSDNYVIYFEKNVNMTRLLIDNWNSSLPTLFVVGSKLYLPNNAQHISSYVPYSEIINSIINSKGIIDLGANNHYFSGILDLAHSYGVNIATNNQWLRFAKPMPSYILSMELFENILMPNADDLKNKINKMLTLSNTRNNIENYNLNVNACLKTMIGTQ
jgi:SAM-dependent methyltransferase